MPSDAEPVGDIRVVGAKLKAVEVGGADIPNLIDELPLVAVLGALARAPRSSAMRPNCG
jgi:3-phosphoshikimate 1-carboxyvinyltransferase